MTTWLFFVSLCCLACVVPNLEVRMEERVEAISRNTMSKIAVYVAAILAIFGTISWYLIAHKDEIVTSILSFFLPDSWVETAALYVNQIIASHPMVVMNTIVTVILIVVPMITFLLKEGVSENFEKDLKAGDSSWQTPPAAPLWVQVVDELLLLIVYASLTLTALRLIVTPGLSAIGTTLSYAVTVTAFAVDFIAPTLARHHVSPTDIYRVLFTRFPLHSISFGLVFTIASSITGLVIMKLSAATSAIVLLSLANAALLVAAVLVGTWVGATMVSESKVLRPSTAKYFAWVAVLALLLSNGTYFYALGKVFYRATPILKCEWRIVPNTFAYDLPSLKDRDVEISFDVETTNPTSRLAEVGDNTIAISHKGERIATTKIPEFSVPPKETVRQHIVVSVKPDGMGLGRKGFRLAKDMWKNGVKATIATAGKNMIDPSLYGVVLELPTPVGSLTLNLVK